MRRRTCSSSVGAGVDYSTANMAKSKLDAVADAAALSAVDHTAISGTAAAAQSAATGVFNAEAVTLNNVTVGNVAVNAMGSAGEAEFSAYNYAYVEDYGKGGNATVGNVSAGNVSLKAAT